MNSDLTLRDAVAGDARPIAETVAGQPLLVRYGVTIDSLVADLEGAVARGDGGLVR